MCPAAAAFIVRCRADTQVSRQHRPARDERLPGQVPLGCPYKADGVHLRLSRADRVVRPYAVGEGAFASVGGPSGTPAPSPVILSERSESKDPDGPGPSWRAVAQVLVGAVCRAIAESWRSSQQSRMPSALWTRCRSRAIVQAVLLLSRGGQSRPPLRSGWGVSASVPGRTRRSAPRFSPLPGRTHRSAPTRWTVTYFS